MKLYLVRHATATERIGGSVKTDADRPLIDVGKKEAEQVAHSLKRLGVKGDLYLTSPLVRARQTAEIFAEVLGNKKSLEFCDALAPGGLVSDIYKQLAGRHVDEVLFFGHQPDMTRIAQSILWSGLELDMPFKKAGVCRIDIADMPPTSPGILKWFITPKIATAFSAAKS